MRRVIKQRQESINKLPEHYGINPQVVAGWEERDYVHGAPIGPKQRCSTGLIPDQPAICLAFRRHMRLPLKDGLYALR